jgi:hypothetical protein
MEASAAVKAVGACVIQPEAGGAGDRRSLRISNSKKTPENLHPRLRKRRNGYMIITIISPRQKEDE